MMLQLPVEWTERELESVRSGTFPFFLYELDPYTAAWCERDARVNAFLDDAYIKLGIRQPQVDPIMGE